VPHQLYSGLGTGLYPVLMLLRPLLERIGGRLAYGFSQRLGPYPDGKCLARMAPQRSGCTPHRWARCRRRSFLSAHSEQLLGIDDGGHLDNGAGNRLARSRMPAGVSCLMAPLDLPQAVRRAMRRLRPDCYICLETELWPVMLHQGSGGEVFRLLLLNGRLSQRSFDRYRHIQGYMASLLPGSGRVAVISEADGRRYEALGVPASRYPGLRQPEIRYAGRTSGQRVRSTVGDALRDSERVLLCGSTHEGEEAQL
jgi:3-deoxy-D-manno-octulosonic-acid transferase